MDTDRQDAIATAELEVSKARRRLWAAQDRLRAARGAEVRAPSGPRPPASELQTVAVDEDPSRWLIEGRR